MKKLTFLFAIFLMLLVPAFAKDGLELVIDSEINEATLMNVKEAIKEAKEKDAIFVLNIKTNSGSTKAAIDIANEILSSKVSSASYSEEDLSNEGAIIALSTDRLYLKKSATIGNIFAESKPLREELNSLITRIEKEKGISRDSIDMVYRRNPKNNKNSMEEFSLDAKTALDYGIIDGALRNFEEIKSIEKLNGGISLFETPKSIDFLHFVSNRYISTAILMIAIVSMVIEVFSPGFGLFGTLSIIAFGIFFIGNIITSESSVYVALIFMLGIALILIEAVIPGFGICGISGIILSVIGIILAMGSFERGLVPTASALVVGMLSANVMIKRGMKSEFLEKITLKDIQSSDLGYLSVDSPEISVGDMCYTLTPLKPTGFIVARDKKLEAISEDGYIEHGEKVYVSKVDGSKIIVRR